MLVQTQWKYLGDSMYDGWSTPFELSDEHPIVCLLELYYINKITTYHDGGIRRQLRRAK